MCGLAGFLNFRGDCGAVISRMTEAIAHRGPDDTGRWIDSELGAALGHKRLAIIDVSPAGHQPMLSACGRYVLVFNGEIYNHLDLRMKLSSASCVTSWRGHSDTETLLAAISRWGLDEALRQAAGMFALAVWDRKTNTLQLARDRLGEKPLYYGWAASSFLFGSELKALKAHPNFEPRICRTALKQYLRFAYVPSPRSIWQGVYKLEPGCILTVSAKPPGCPPPHPVRPGQNYETISIARYWSLAEVTKSGARNPIVDVPDAIDELERTLERAVHRQMISDVPLGAFLSGGVDSSAIVALMQKNNASRVKTYTIGFEDKNFDESEHAKAVANHLGTLHTEIQITAAEARAVIPSLPDIFDEPFADASQIPTYLVCKAARPHVTVALTGDAGDELFGGYARYLNAPGLWKRLNSVPFPVRRGAGNFMAGIPVEWWDAARGAKGRAPTGPQSTSRAVDKFYRLGERLSTVQSIDDLYLNLVSAWPDPADILLSASDDQNEDMGLLADPSPVPGAEEAAARMMYQDAMTYLPDDILCKVDRVAMAVSLETRAPLLDPDVVEMAARLPLSMKVHQGVGKWILRQVLYKYVPRSLIERPKVGFFLPVGDWLKSPLRDWAETLLAEKRLKDEGILDPAPIRKMWEEHVSGRRDWTFQIWTVLMFQAWLDANHVDVHTAFRV